MQKGAWAFFSHALSFFDFLLGKNAYAAWIHASLTSSSSVPLINSLGKAGHGGQERGKEK